MKAIILAAGRGSRMRSATSNQPKSFTELHGKRLIEWQMDALKNAGISDIAIVRGYLSEMFQYNVQYFENRLWAQTNMLKSLCMAASWLENDECVISYSDIVYSSRSVEKLALSSADIAITYDPNWLDLWRLRFDDPLSDAETFRLDGDSNLVEIGNRALSTVEIEGQYMGLLKFKPNGWRSVEKHLSSFSEEEINKMDMTKLLRSLITHGVKVHAVRIDDPWYEVDNEHDLSQYEKPGVFKL